MKKISRGLLSVSDKTGVEDFARGLATLGVEILSTGGTARLLREHGIAVRDISDLTGFPELLDGRVKTLHPRVHGGILAVRSRATHQEQTREHGIEFIDLVAVNLYPFERTAARSNVTFDQLIENIDIGGPAMIRSAAKNFEDVAVIVDAADYAPLLEEARANGGEVSRATRARLARKAFAVTAAYDAAIGATLESWGVGEATAAAAASPGARASVEGAAKPRALYLPEHLQLSFRKLVDLRYGENPHQAAALYLRSGAPEHGLAAARQWQGKELSYNNLADLDAAWNLVQEFAEPATAIIKHANPCGASAAAEGGTLVETYQRALAVDPVAAFGSAIAFNRPVDAPTAVEVAKLFVEAIVAPGYTPEARAQLAAKRNLRLLEIAATAGEKEGLEFKVISGGLLAQTPDAPGVVTGEWKCVTRRAPTPAEGRALEFAWRVVKHVKSNAIVYAHENVLVGVGAGQMSRVDAVKLAGSKARELGHDLAGTVVASDAFFPFADGVEEAARAGATAAVQPGGSVRDSEVIAAADRLGLAMMFTGVRHFRH